MVNTGKSILTVIIKDFSDSQPYSMKAKIIADKWFSVLFQGIVKNK